MSIWYMIGIFMAIIISCYLLHADPATSNQNWDLLSDSEKEIAQILCQLGQEHLFRNWPAPSIHDDGKHGLLAQISDIHRRYPGGIQGYVANAKKLMQPTSEGVNLFHGFTLHRPDQLEILHFNTKELDEAESLGMDAIPYTAFVLVAGESGRHLAYDDTKLSLPIDVISKDFLIQHFIEFILAYQDRARAMTKKSDVILPLVIMTSDETHGDIEDLLTEFHYFGMEQSQISLMKQDNVPVFADIDAHFVLANDDPFSIVTEPHGHGDVHTLLHRNHIVANWIKNYGTRHIFFFQDTNVAVFRAFPAALGMSVKNGFEVNLVSVARKPGEDLGAICTLKSETQTLTINIESNQFNELLDEINHPDGDRTDPTTGYSPFPGNINAFIVAAQPYSQMLQKTEGYLPEYCNPEFADSTETMFTSPIRLKCFMQDYLRLLDSNANVGVTQLDRFMTYSAIKHNLSDGLVQQMSTGFSQTPAAAESDFYLLNLELLKLGGSKIVVHGGNQFVEFAGIPVTAGPRISLAPAFGVTQQEIRDALKDSSVEITQRSSFVLKGRGTWIIEKVHLDGAVAVHTAAGSRCILKYLNTHNLGIEFEPVDPLDMAVEDVYRIRGYKPYINSQGIIRSDKSMDNVIEDLDD